MHFCFRMKDYLSLGSCRSRPETKTQVQIIELGGRGRSTVEGCWNETGQGRNHERAPLELKPAGELWEGEKMCLRALPPGGEEAGKSSQF